MLVNRDTSIAAAATKAQVSFSDGGSELHPMTSRNKNKNKRRFSDEQTRLLESMFEAEERPELQIKQQLANELGLQTRQVAIWFQNKRARSRSKLIEQEYNMLKSSYDTLASKFDSMKKENQCLLIQLKKLRNLMGNPQGVGRTGKGIDEKYDCNHHENQMTLCDDSSKYREYFGEETDILNMVELVPDGSLTSYGNWCSFESSFEPSCVLDQPSRSSQWWDL